MPAPRTVTDSSCKLQTLVKVADDGTYATTAYERKIVTDIKLVRGDMTHFWSVVNRGIARNSFLVGIIFLLHDTTVLYTSSLTTSSAAISAQNNFQGLILGGYIYRYTPVATPLVVNEACLSDVFTARLT